MTSLFGGSSPSSSSVVSAAGNAGMLSFVPNATSGSFTHSSEMEKRKQQIIQEMRSEAALVMAQNFINVRYFVYPSKIALLKNSSIQTINEKCFLKCVTKPSTSLSGSEEVRVLLSHLRPG